MKRPLPLADLACVTGCVAVLLLFDALPRADRLSAGLPLLAGVALVLGMSCGHLARRLGLPRLTGWLLGGLLVNPTLPEALAGVSGWRPPVLVRVEHATSLASVGALAVGIIALMGGMEIRVAAVRAASRAIGLLTVTLLATVPLAVAGLVIAWRPEFLVAAIADSRPEWAVAMLTGLLVVTGSPTVVVSVLRETRASGPLSTIVLGTTMVLDTVVIAGFAALVAIIDAGDGGVSLAGVGGRVAAGIIASLAAGALIGVGLRVYSERSDHHLTWLLLGLAAATAVAGPALGLKPLFVLLAAGFACENVGRRSRLGRARVEAALARVGQPVLIAFFVATGMNLHVDLLALLIGFVLALTALSAALTWLSAGLALRLAAVEPRARRLAWMGLLSKAGMTLALSQVVADRFPGWGAQLATAIVALVALHELFAPLLLSTALQRAGEAGARAGSIDDSGAQRVVPAS